MHITLVTADSLQESIPPLSAVKALLREKERESEVYALLQDKQSELEPLQFEIENLRWLLERLRNPGAPYLILKIEMRLLLTNSVRTGD